MWRPGSWQGAVLAAACLVLVLPGSAPGEEWAIASIDSPLFVVGGQSLTLTSGEPTEWFRRVPVPGDYDNSRTCEGTPRPACLDAIAHRDVPLGRTDRLVLEDLDLGTHRLVAGTSDPRVLEVVVRRDDSYVGFLTEQLGTPFVFYPARVPGLGHQTDARIGADCVALAIYGQRRMGREIPYVAPMALYRFTNVVSSSAAEVVTVARGDVLHFGWQTAVVSEDVHPIGVLTDEDVIIHTFHEAVEEVLFGELPYRGRPFEVLRWPTTGRASD